MQNWNQLVSNSYLEFAAAPGDQSVDVNLQSDPAVRALQTSHAVRIANQKIGETQRYAIERTPRCHAKLAESEAAAVLHCSLESGQNNGRNHSCSASNCARVILLKRTRSPGRKRVGGFSFALNKRKGCTTSDRLLALHRLCRNHRIAPPFILKPDFGQRGNGVRLVRSLREALDYLLEVDTPVILQRYAPGPSEVGVFYFRRPGEARGR